MNIVVCIKQVPDPNRFSDITLDPVTGVIKREDIPAVINPNDRNAIEAGLQIKEKFSGKVSILTMGPLQAREALEEALAMGGDDAIHLCDRAFAGADTLATARTLATAIRSFCPFDLILCGNETIDSGTSQVGPQLAEFLDISHVSNVGAINFIVEDVLQVERSLGSARIKVKVRLPALIAVNGQINQPRFPTVVGIMGVAGKALRNYGLTDLKLSPEQVGLTGSPTRLAGLFESGWKRRGEMLQGEPEQIAREAAVRIRKALTTK